MRIRNRTRGTTRARWKPARSARAASTTAAAKAWILFSVSTPACAYQGDGTNCDLIICQVDFVVFNCQVIPGDLPGLRTVLFDVAILPSTLLGEWNVGIQFLVDGVEADFHTLTAVRIGLASCPTNDRTGCPEPSSPPCGQLQWIWKGLGATNDATCEGQGGTSCKCQFPTISPLEKQNLPMGSNYTVIIDVENAYPELSEDNNVCTVEVTASDLLRSQ